ncbi:MAG TPA: sodium:solute symporter family protein, partial [Vicinamibacteria bacterium]|nr:sodium:solute symporter family protein [Vicinamibacteria bacterium]
MNGIPLSVGAILFVATYLGSMIALGLAARRARKSDNLSDFYLAGRSLGPLVLLLTLYATQYSGNTIVGYPGESYRLGYAWMMSVSFMMSIVVVYLLFAPRLQRLARQHGFVTPGDFLDYRFRSPALSVVINIILVVSIGNYLLAQLMAMGHVVAGVSDNNLPYWLGIVVLVVVIIAYETLGGLRAVAWTDCVQGLMLLVGLFGLLYAFAPTPSDWHAVTDWLNRNAPEKTAVPDRETQLRWLSTVVLIGFSASVYPQAIQRIYAARSTRVLKRSLQVLVFMPLVTTTVVVLVGLVGIRRYSGLAGIQADQVLPLLLHEWSQESAYSYAMAVLVVTGTLAAIMSTADSVLLSLSSILSKDLLGKTVLRGASEERLTAMGKRISWLVMALLAIIAVTPRITLWGLIELKAEILVQASPAFVLGSLWPGLAARGVL